MRAASTAALLAALCTTACGRIDRDDIAKIQTGMSRAQVHALLGEPVRSSSGRVGDYVGASDTWYSDNQEVTVQYLDDEVKLTTLRPRDHDNQ